MDKIILFPWRLKMLMICNASKIIWELQNGVSTVAEVDTM